MEDISTSHRAQTVAAGTDSTLAKKACVVLCDKLSQIARTRNVKDETLDTGSKVCTCTTEDEVFTLQSFKEGWKIVLGHVLDTTNIPKVGANFPMLTSLLPRNTLRNV